MAKHYRKSYEKLYLRLCWEVDENPKKVEFLSDFSLLMSINELLIKWNCTPLTQDELELNLI